MTISRSTTAVALSVFGTLALVGCSDASATAPSPTNWAVSVGGGAVGSGNNPQGGTEPSSSAQSPDGDDDATGSEGSFPVGEWILDNSSWERSLMVVMNTFMPMNSVVASGSIELDWIEGGTYVLRASQAQTTATGVAEGIPFTQSVTHHGTEHGTWSGSGSSFALTESTSDMTSRVTLSADGYSQAYDQNDFAPEPWAATMTIGCDGDRMSTTVTEESGTLTVEWVRR